MRRIGKVVAEQVALYGTLTGEHRAATGDRDEPAREERRDRGPEREDERPREGARVLRMPSRADRGRRAEGS